MVPTAIIIIHQIIFQGMFIARNVTLRHKLGVPIRGKNREATLSVAFFALFILCAIVLSLFAAPVGRVTWLSETTAVSLTLGLLALDLLISAASLLHLGSSWRVGVVEAQHTALVEDGIYRFSRNPYFFSYLVMFAAYTILLQNLILLLLSLVGFALIHAMVLKEEKHLINLHGDVYRQYRRRVPRYGGFWVK